jgi:hypothetical protein
MKWMLACSTVLLLATTVAPAAAPPEHHPLAELSWLVGGVWVAETHTPDGKPLRVEFKCDWAEHGMALKYVIHFKTGDETVPQYEGMYYWHPAKKRLAMVQVDRYGNVTESTATTDGGNVTQENQATGSDGVTRPQRATVTRNGDDAFDFKAMVKRGDEWVEGLALTYRRERRK